MRGCAKEHGKNRVRHDPMLSQPGCHCDGCRRDRASNGRDAEREYVDGAGLPVSVVVPVDMDDGTAAAEWWADAMGIDS